MVYINKVFVFLLKIDDVDHYDSMAGKLAEADSVEIPRRL
jgi:hypothetical protein